jgi:drug/metabolite transporter (DMT)-like permease
MWDYFAPILLIVASNIIYNIATKSTPGEANPFLSLTVTYMVGTFITFVAYWLSFSDNLLIKKLNWTSFLLGFAIVGLEVGYIYLYRAGWNIGIGSLVANIILAIALIGIGVLFYKEQINFQQIIGLVLCIGGLILINKK